MLERQIAHDDHQDDHEHRRAAERGRIGRDRDEPRRADGLARIVRVAQVAEQSFVELAQIALQHLAGGLGEDQESQDDAEGDEQDDGLLAREPAEGEPEHPG